MYYAGQLFVGSKHTTNPLAISKKIFENFIQRGGNYIKENVKNISQKNNSAEIILDDQTL